MRNAHRLGRGCRIRRHHRAGLAPLELTLVLPTLMCMLALMINFGVAGAWKVRTQVAARYAGWGSVAARTGSFNAPPDNWPANATWEAVSGTNLPEVDQLWNSQADLLAPAVRGPVLSSPHQTVVVPVEGRLEMDEEVHRGHAQVQRPLPLLRGATRDGQFGFNLNEDLMDNCWQFFDLGFQHNEDMRALDWYAIEHHELAMLDPTLGGSYQRVQRAWRALRENPTKCQLYVLDRDNELARYYGRADDFYPRIHGCSMDVEDVSQRLVRPLLTQIEALPCTIGRRFSNMYREWICGLETCHRPDAAAPMIPKYEGLRRMFDSVTVCGIKLERLKPCPACPGQCACPPIPGPDNCDPQ